jgi:Tfp pilus assembly protein PilF
VRLFVERARAVRFDFVLTPENAAAVAGICARLDGLPLAIELVAARSRLLPPQALLDRLDGAYGESPLQMLTNGPLDLPSRHRALRTAIAWSYDLLSPEEQTLFARLAVFAGGCTLPAVQAVCNALGDLGISVLDGVQSLLDKSLLREVDHADSEPRFAMLSTIRAFALEQLAGSGTEATQRGWHAEYCQALAETADPHLTGMEQPLWVARLAGEHDNIREALRWALEAGRIDLAARLSAAVWRFWLIHGYLTEGRHWLERVVAVGEALPADLRARVLHGAGALADNQDDTERAGMLYRESLALRRKLGDRQGIAHLLNNLGTAEYHRGNYAQAEALFAESLAIKRALGDAPGIASSLNNLGLVAHDQGQLTRAAALFEESLARARALGHAHGTIVALNNLAYELRYLEEYPRAQALYAEARGLATDLGARRELGSALHGLADLARVRGERGAARALYRQALTLRHELGDRRNLALSLLGVAALLTMEEQWVPACRLFGAAEVVAARPLATWPPAEQAEFGALVAQAHSVLGEGGYTSAWEAGQGLLLTSVVAEALAGLEVRFVKSTSAC